MRFADHSPGRWRGAVKAAGRQRARWVGTTIMILGTGLGLLVGAVGCGQPFEPDTRHPLWEQAPLVLAHKGGLGPYPENTIPAFQWGLENGAHGVEMDVQRCATGEVVVFHDYEVDELTDGTGTVTEMTLAELQVLTYDYRDDFHGTAPIPTLEEVLDALSGDALLDIELKGEGATTEGLEAAVARIVIERGLQPRTIITSFNPFRVKRIENEHPGLLTGLITGPELPWYAESHRYVDWSMTDAVVPFTGWTDAGYFRLHEGYPIIAWFEDEDIEDDEAEYRRLLRLGVWGLVTDHPFLVRAMIDSPRWED
jgi:glycerophosphoryl diester phosphodiesterase